MPWLVVEVSFKVATDSFYNHFFLVAGSCNEACVLFEQHDGVVKSLFLGSFVDEMVPRFKDRVDFYTVSEIL